MSFIAQSPGFLYIVVNVMDGITNILESRREGDGILWARYSGFYDGGDRE